ncbi:MAG: hypothetical protein ABEI06_01475, partial [Halobacteriaceae archaeon]
MTAEQVSKWARRFVLSSAAFLLVWQFSVLLDYPRNIGVILGVYGFVLHMIFGKAYSLLPSYFDRDLQWGQAPAFQLPLTVLGTICLSLGWVSGAPTWVKLLGSVLWTAGIIIFVGTILWTIRDNLLAVETATSDVNVERKWIDRLANVFMLGPLAYLLIGSYQTLAMVIALPTVILPGMPRTAHLLAAGVGALMIFAVGFRLLPRFLVAYPPRFAAVVVLPSGTIGPLLLAYSFRDGIIFQIGAILEAIAVVGFVGVYSYLFLQTDRNRIGFYGVLLAMGYAIVGIGLGLQFAFADISHQLTTAHYRVNILGFLGLTIVGVAYQFYPPGIGGKIGVSDRGGLASIGIIGTGLAIEIIGYFLATTWISLVGTIIILGGVILYGYILVQLFLQRYDGL